MKTFQYTVTETHTVIYEVQANSEEEARELAARNPQLTNSYLERRLKIGGRKAEEIMELLEDEGFLDIR